MSCVEDCRLQLAPICWGRREQSAAARGRKSAMRHHHSQADTNRQCTAVADPLASLPLPPCAAPPPARRRPLRLSPVCSPCCASRCVGRCLQGPTQQCWHAASCGLSPLAAAAWFWAPSPSPVILAITPLCIYRSLRFPSPAPAFPLPFHHLVVIVSLCRSYSLRSCAAWSRTRAPFACRCR